jgi:transposase InsO family protein
MSATRSPSANTEYAVAIICETWGVPRSTFYDWRERQRKNEPLGKPGPKTELTDERLLEAIRGVLTNVEKQLGIRGEGYRKVWARLRHKGLCTTKRRVLRVMRENTLLAPSRQRRARGPRTHDGKIQTPLPNQMWGTDATQVSLRCGQLIWVFLAVDHCNSELVGIHASSRGDRFEALQPIHQGVQEHFGGLAQNVAKDLKVRHDHGSQYMSHDFQKELKFLGVESSPSFVASPEGNGVAERMVRTVKEQLLWVETFDTVEDLRLALQAFRARYNENWLVSRHGNRTPAQVRRALTATRQLAPLSVAA